MILMGNGCIDQCVEFPSTEYEKVKLFLDDLNNELFELFGEDCDKEIVVSNNKVFESAYFVLQHIKSVDPLMDAGRVEKIYDELFKKYFSGGI